MYHLQSLSKVEHKCSAFETEFAVNAQYLEWRFSHLEPPICSTLDSYYESSVIYRMEIRIQFDHVPGNIYWDRLGYNIDLASNELMLRDVPDEDILIRVNNKFPGLSLHLDASELNLLYKDKYDVEEPDSYEHLILDVIDGDHHLFMRSDELAAAWNILTLVLHDIDKRHISPVGGRGPVGACYLCAKHGFAG